MDQETSVTRLRRAKPLLGTLVEIGLAHGDLHEHHSSAIVESGFAAIARIHQLMSNHDPVSELSQLNDCAVGQWFAVDPHTMQVLEFCLQLNQLSDGIFDPCAHQVEQTSCRDLALDKKNMRVKRCRAIHLDLGGVAKGYAVDCAVSAMQSEAILQGCEELTGWVNAGGDCAVFGTSRLPLLTRLPWALTTPIAAELISNCSAATSANDPSVLTHINHGNTRLSAGTRVCATVVAPTCMMADALTKVVLATVNQCDDVLKFFGARSWYFSHH